MSTKLMRSNRKSNYWLSFIYFSLCAFVFFITLGYPKISLGARLKDIATVKGVRENILIGYGIVVGLKGTGDSSTEVTSQSLGRLFGKLGLDVQEGVQVKSKNAAAVIVTAKLPPFSRVGNKIDTTVSSIGDAKSLEGGMLLVTPLRAGDQNVYAVAQGLVTLGGVNDGSSAFPTVGRVVSGASIEREVENNFTNKNGFRLSLNHADFTTAARITALINAKLGGKFATSQDSGTIDVIMPFQYESNAVELLATLEDIQVNIDSKAKVILNERTGTVVIGANVNLMPVAISHGDLTLQIQQTPQAPAVPEAPPRVLAQQGAAAPATPVVPENLGFVDANGPVRVLNMTKKATVSDLVRALNAMGVKPKDMTAIFQTLRQLGALQAELEIM